MKKKRTRLQNKSKGRKSSCVQYDFISMFFIIELRQKSKCERIRTTCSKKKVMHLINNLGRILL